MNTIPSEVRPIYPPVPKFPVHHLDSGAVTHPREYLLQIFLIVREISTLPCPDRCQRGRPGPSFALIIIVEILYIQSHGN
jgi:hypothetical protein